MELEIDTDVLKKSIIKNADLLSDIILKCIEEHKLQNISSKDELLDFLTDLARDTYIYGYIQGIKSMGFEP